jgi:hypothetical protein
MTKKHVWIIAFEVWIKKIGFGHNLRVHRLRHWLNTEKTGLAG